MWTGRVFRCLCWYVVGTVKFGQGVIYGDGHDMVTRWILRTQCKSSFYLFFVEELSCLDG